MTREIDRRTLLKGSLVLAASGTVVACSDDRVVPGPSATAPSPAATEAAGGGPTSERPTRVTSFGPNGTHYPDDVPWLGERAATELVAECSWQDIGRTIQGLLAEEVAAGVIIRVKPGTLAGGGAGSSAPAVLTNVGNPAWTRNVVVCPLDGFGSVAFASTGIRIDQSARVSLFGFVGSGAFTMTRCQNVQVGWGRFDAMSITRGGRDIALFELVLGFRQNSDDTVGVRPIETFPMVNLTRDGCVFGPSVKPDGDDSHCDTIQLEGTGTGVFGPVTTTDCVDYGSSNAAELLDDKLTLAEYRHCLILGGQLPWQVYPLRPGDYPGDPNAFSGDCQDVRLTDTVVAGAIGRMGFTQVQNSTLSYAPTDSQQPRESGAWIVDPSVAEWTREQIMGQQAIPDYEISTLRALWSW
ncbi:hypothetical protein [Herbiconiux daphne]|uniref:Uncharacterized protein n=1 Tax=Herbiconiux daphne TaxID=2970914 RepID=A0ABT2H6P1_9MICO|nr:hypothetical protein [Herbiconiux daphne]MCS5735596.1 hypothetical protein [Herbiconiux daphne]